MSAVIGSPEVGEKRQYWRVEEWNGTAWEPVRREPGEGIRYDLPIATYIDAEDVLDELAKCDEIGVDEHERWVAVRIPQDLWLIISEDKT